MIHQVMSSLRLQKKFIVTNLGSEEFKVAFQYHKEGFQVTRNFNDQCETNVWNVQFPPVIVDEVHEVFCLYRPRPQAYEGHVVFP